MINHPPRPDMGVRDRTTQQRFLVRIGVEVIAPPDSALSALKTKKKGEEKGGKRKERREEEKTAVESAVERGVRTRTARRTHATHTPLTAHRTKQSLADRTMGKACIRAK